MFSSPRRFQLWHYNVSHARLMLRSPISPECETNIDVVFWDVRYVDLATAIDGLTIAHGDDDEHDRVRRIITPRDTSAIFRLTSSNRRYLVVAWAFAVYENRFDLFDDRFEHVGMRGMTDNHGTRLAHSPNIYMP